MRLDEYVAEIPFGERGAFRRRLAKAHGVSSETVRKWEGYPPPADWSKQKVRDMSRPHPASTEAIAVTEQMTDGKVTRFDLRPDIFQREKGARE